MSEYDELVAATRRNLAGEGRYGIYFIGNQKTSRGDLAAAKAAAVEQFRDHCRSKGFPDKAEATVSWEPNDGAWYLLYDDNGAWRSAEWSVREQAPEPIVSLTVTHEDRSHA